MNAPAQFHESSSSDSESDEPLEVRRDRERSRQAAQKWRKKKEQYLKQLESTNASLRREALHLAEEVQCLERGNKVLITELQFFQSYTSMIMQASV
jgi:hypothetical protein